MKFLIILLLFLSGSMLLSSDAQIISHNPGGIVGEHHLRTGIPFAKGACRSLSGLAVFSGERELPTQLEVLSRYPDGSFRWVAADFLSPLDGKPEQKYTLRSSASKNLRGKIFLKETEKSISIDTGKVTFTIGKNKFFAAPGNGKSLDLFFKDASGKLYSASSGVLDSVQITVKGDIRTAVSIEGWFGSEDNKKSCRYILHLDFYSGSSIVRSGFTFIITEEKDKARFSEITLAVPGNYTDGKIGGIEGDAMGKYLLQYAYDKYLAGTLNEPRQYSETGDGKHAPGWIKSGKTALFMEDFKENFPSELALTENNIFCHLWPAHGVAKPDRKVTSADRQYLWFCHENSILDFNAPQEYLNGDGHGKHYIAQAKEESCLGLAKTMYCRIDFDAPQEISSALTSPPAALPDKKQVAESEVFGAMQVYDPQKNPEEESLIERRFGLERKLSESTGPGDFGKWNYGDGHSIWRNNINRWDDSWRTWKGYHHVSGSVPWILALRKTGWKEFKRAIAVSRHLADVDICHYDTEESIVRSKKRYAVSGKIKGGLNDYKGLTHWHAGDRLFDYNAQTEYALTWWYLTGDRRGLEVAKMWGDAVVKHFKRTWDKREGTGTAGALVDLYYAVPDRRYLEIAGKFVDHVLRTQTGTDALPASRRQAGSLNGWANYAPGLRKYYELTGDKKVELAICRWADAFMMGYGDTTSTGAKLHDCVDVMAYAWMITKNKKYLEHGRWLLDNYIYLYQSDDPAKCKPFESVEYFMMERISLFLAAQDAYGKKLVPKPLEYGLPEFSYRTSGKPKAGDHAVYLKGDGKPFTIEAGAGAADKHPVSFSLETADGKVLCQKYIKPDKEKLANCRITADPAPEGVYILKVRKRPISLRVRCRLKQCSDAGTIYSYSGGGSYAFEVTEPGILEWKCRPNLPVYPVFAAIESPEGKWTHWRFYAPRDGKEKRFRIKVTPGIWRLSGIFAPMPSNLKLNRTPIRYLSPSRSKYFDPEKVPAGNTKDAKAVINELKN